MNNKRKIEVFSAGCPACDEAIAVVNSVACPSCEITILSMSDKDVAARAKSLGIHRVPAVVIDGKVAECCRGTGEVDADALARAGVGQQ